MMLTPEQLAELRFALEATIHSPCLSVEAAHDLFDHIDAQQARIAELEKKAALHDQIMRACGELPEGWEIVIELENGAGTVSLFDPEYREVEYPEDHESMAHAVGDAIDAALTWPEDTSDYGSRIAVIGQNGATGEHYDEESKP